MTTPVQPILAEEIAGMLVRIEANWTRETSGPGSRFEGRTLESVQAEAVLRRVAEREGDRWQALKDWMGEMDEADGQLREPYHRRAGIWALAEAAIKARSAVLTRMAELEEGK